MAGFGDVLQDAFVSNDADITASSGDGEEDGEEDGASFVDDKKRAFDSDSDPDPDEEEDASRATDGSSRFRSEEASEQWSEQGPEQGPEQSFADEEEEALVSSETRPVVSEDPEWVESGDSTSPPRLSGFEAPSPRPRATPMP